MLKGISSDNFEINLIESEKERGVALYDIRSNAYYDDYGLKFDSINFETIDELIELLQFIKQNNIK